MLFSEKFSSIFRNASPYWEVKWVEEAKSTPTPAEIASGDAYKFRYFPLHIIRKLTSIYVRQEGKASVGRITFDNLTVLEADHPCFSFPFELMINTGWWDFFATKPSKCAIACGVVVERDFKYNEGGISVTLTIAPRSLVKLHTSFGSNYPLPIYNKTLANKATDEDRQRMINTAYDLRKMTLRDFLDEIGRATGATVWYIPTDDSLKLDEKRLNFYIGIENSIADKTQANTDPSVMTATLPKFQQWVLDDNGDNITPIWCNYHNPAYRQKLMNEVRIEDPATQKPVRVKKLGDTYIDLLWAVVRIQYGLDFDIYENTIVVHGRSEEEMSKYADKAFVYRGANYDYATGRRLTAGQSSFLANVGYLSFLDEDPFENFEVVSKKLDEIPTRVASVKKSNGGQGSMNPDGVQSRPDAFLYDISYGDKDAPKSADIRTKIRTDSYIDAVLRSNMPDKQKQEAIQNYTGADKKAMDREYKAALEEKKNNLVKFSTQPVEKTRNLFKTTLYGQRARVTGAIGDHTIAIGGYFHFSGRLEDTGFYKIDMIEHIFDVANAYKMNMEGILTPPPKRKPVKLSKVPGGWIYLVHLATETGNEPAPKKQPHFTEAQGKGLAPIDGSKLRESEGYYKHFGAIQSPLNTRIAAGDRANGTWDRMKAEQYLSPDLAASQSGMKAEKGYGSLEHVYEVIPISVDTILHVMRYGTPEEKKKFEKEIKAFSHYNQLRRNNAGHMRQRVSYQQANAFIQVAKTTDMRAVNKYNETIKKTETYLKERMQVSRTAKSEEKPQ